LSAEGFWFFHSLKTKPGARQQIYERMNEMPRDEYKETLVRLYNSGKSIKEICEEYNVPKSTFYRWLKKYDTREPKITEDDIKVLLGKLAALEEENTTIKKVLYMLNKANRT
jgi:transposase